MRRAPPTVALLLALAGVGCERAEPAAPPAPSPDGTMRATGTQGAFTFELAFDPPSPTVGELFRVVTTVRDAKTGAPVQGARFSLDATMPHHGHGMMTVPEHRERGAGRYESRGMKLHMHGRWTFTAHASRGGRQDRVAIEHEQPPR
jgi:hypothetical protein